MITKDNPSMNSTAESIYMSNSDEQIRELCRRREDAIAHENYQKKLIQELTNQNASLNDKVSSLTNAYESISNENAYLRKLLEDNNIKVE